MVISIIVVSWYLNYKRMRRILKRGGVPLLLKEQAKWEVENPRRSLSSYSDMDIKSPMYHNHRQMRND